MAMRSMRSFYIEGVVRLRLIDYHSINANSYVYVYTDQPFCMMQNAI